MWRELSLSMEAWIIAPAGESEEEVMCAGSLRRRTGFVKRIDLFETTIRDSFSLYLQEGWLP